MNWLIGIAIDIILLVILFLCIKKGSKDGFAKTIVNSLGILIALVFALMLSRPVANFVYEKVIEPPVKNAIVLNIEEQKTSGEADVNKVISTMDSTIERLPGFIKNNINLEEKKQQITNALSVSNINSEEIAKKICAEILMPVCLSILTAIVFIVLFIVFAFVIKIIAKALKIVNKLPLLGAVNSALGGAAGIIKGIVIVLIINWVVVHLVVSRGELFKIITAQTIESSLIMKNLANINPINLLFTFNK